MARGKTDSSDDATLRGGISLAYEEKAFSRSWPELNFSWDAKDVKIYTYENTKIIIADGYPSSAYLAVVSLLADLPDKVKKQIKQVTLTDTAPNKDLAAICDHENRELVFFGHKQDDRISVRLTPITFFHEAGHLAEEVLDEKTPMDQVILEYKTCQKSDFENASSNSSQTIDDAVLLMGDFHITQYAKECQALVSEDFAESFALYMNQKSLQSRGKDAGYDFAKLYPARALFIEKYLTKG